MVLCGRETISAMTISKTTWLFFCFGAIPSNQGVPLRYPLVGVFTCLVYLL
jgi:hypothetical protein